MTLNCPLSLTWENNCPYNSLQQPSTALTLKTSLILVNGKNVVRFKVIQLQCIFLPEYKHKSIIVVNQSLTPIRAVFGEISRLLCNHILIL